MGIKSIKSFTNPGDAVASLCGIKHYCDENNAKVIFYQQKFVLNDYYVGAVHPTKNQQGQQVCCNDVIFDMMLPLFKNQYYIEDFLEWKGEQVDFDLGKIRHEVFVNLPSGAIQNWDGLFYPEFQGADISSYWLSGSYIDGYFKDKIAINFTQRYRNVYISYYFLKIYEKKLVFFGSKDEYNLFTNQWRLKIEHVEINDFLHLTSLLQSCKFFLGNQSLMWNICQAAGVPRILEICAQFPNCIHGIGKHSYGFLNQHSLEMLFKKLFELL